MARLARGTWVVVADGEKALFLVNEGSASEPNLVVERTLANPNPSTREQGSDRPGRYNDGPNVHRSAVEDTDWHRLGKERFAGDLAEILYKAAHAGGYDKLIVVAPPKTLGDLRKHLHAEVVDRLVDEIHKDLTNHTVDDIEAALTRDAA